MKTKRSITPSRHEQRNQSLVRSLQGSDTFKALITKSVFRAVEKQRVKCESAETIGELTVQDKKYLRPGDSFQCVIEFKVEGDEANKLLRDDDGNLFTAFQAIGGPLIDVESIKLRGAFEWFLERYRNTNGCGGEIGDLMELALPYLPEQKQNRKINAQAELPGLK
jgi:hypothetical protein